METTKLQTILLKYLNATICYQNPCQNRAVRNVKDGNVPFMPASNKGQNWVALVLGVCLF